MFAFRAVWLHLEMECPEPFRVRGETCPRRGKRQRRIEDTAMSPCAQYMAFGSIRKAPATIALRVSSA